MRVACIRFIQQQWPMSIGHWRQWPMGIGHCCCINRIHRTRVGSRSSRAYTATQRYTVYSYTSLYTIHPLQHPSGPVSIATSCSATSSSALYSSGFYSYCIAISTALPFRLLQHFCICMCPCPLFLPIFASAGDRTASVDWRPLLAQLRVLGRPAVRAHWDILARLNERGFPRAVR